MEDEKKETMATSDGSSATPIIHHVESSTEPTGVTAPKTSPPNQSSQKEQPKQETMGNAKDKNTPPTPAVQPEEESNVNESDKIAAQKAEDLVVVVEEKGALQSSSSSDSRSENQDGIFPRETADVTMPSGVSTVSMPPPHILADPDLWLHRSRSETDASLPSVDVGSPSPEEMSNLQEFLSSPHGNNQIVERSPGGRYVRFMEKLGSGASKDVYRAYDTEEGIEVAWNVVHLAGVPKNERNRIVNEVRLLERLHHQNIISFHGSWVNRERQQVNFVTEILSSGTLKSFINKVQVIRWKIAKRWAVQILKGLEYLHSQNPPVIHRDLKCENIFINGTSGDLRIGDLGLSTVHRNGRVLSVLGTPEFMAPDMYEEGSYDEKVDIYAFGMCLLEIFTKEIPYRECNNPAQIYKKVMRGAPPDSLARLKSTHAREFIELCMGYRNDDGTYVRPSATELLAHPFLIKRPNDDDEVEVEPALQEQPIREVSGSLEYGSEANASKGNPTSAQSNPSGSKDSSPKLRASTRTNSLEEEESDRFEEMPDSEINSIRRVKVLMGRGEELNEAEDAALRKTKVAASAEGITTTEIASASSQQNLQLKEAEANKLHYLVAAAVIEENEQTQFQQPYADDILKLVVTLPVEGQTQNVQFDFHLVEDDPIQVAKEMVAELGIPQGAVLEISETISSLARAARTKKHNYSAAQAQRAVNQQNHARSHSQSIGSAPSSMSQQPPQQHQPQGQNGMQQQQPPQHMTQHPVPDYLAPPTQQQHLQQMPQGQEQNYQQPMQPQQGMPYQDQSAHLHAQHLGQTPPMSMQVQQIQQQQQQQHNSVVGGESDSHLSAQAQYGQQGMQMQSLPQSQLPNQSHQQHQGMVNGEYHRNIPGDSKLHQAPNYSQILPQAHMDSRSLSNVNAPQGPQQGASHQQVTQNSNQSTADSQLQTAGNSYPMAQGTVQQVQAPAPSGPCGSYQPSQHDASSQQAQYHYAQQQNPAAHSQGIQPGGPHPLPLSQQPQHHQQFQVVPQNIGQNYGQSIPQHSFPSAQGQPQHQQHSMQQGQNASQHMPQQLIQQMQNIPLQQPPMQQTQGTMPQSQQQQQPLLQQPQSMNNQQQQHVGQPQQQQQGLGQQRQQAQQPVMHAVPVQQQLSGQPVVSAASTSNMQQYQNDLSSGGEYARSAHSSPSPIIHRREGSSGTTDQSTDIQRDSMSDLSVGALGGLPMDLSSDDELVDVDDPTVQQLRQLDEDFKKNLMRAKKVFVNRMDNLQRTQVQREAQHKKTLEQHQKDRAAFEKRLQQEEIEQNRRIEQMQKEWDRRREEVRMKQHSDEKSLSSTPPAALPIMIPEATGIGVSASSTSALSGNDPALSDR